MPDPKRVLILFTALALVTAACSTTARSTPDAAADADPDELAVVVASFDLAVGDGQRLLAGVFTPDRRIVGGGEVEMMLSRPSEDGTPEPAGSATGRFLPVPGTDTPTDLAAPTILDEPAAHEHGSGQDGTPHDHGDLTAGVYAAEVDLDRPGIWELTVTATVDGVLRKGSTAFEVLPGNEVPMPGDPAPRVATPTLDDGLPPEAIDSRAISDGVVPDEILHTTDVADALAAGRPTVVVFSTPTYCTSRFCGPITDTVEELAHRYSDRAAFVHVEIWRDADAARMNAAVAPWIATEAGGNEPWVFLIGADGMIAARWDNVLDEAELTSLLEQLPPH